MEEGLGRLESSPGSRSLSQALSGTRGQLGTEGIGGISGCSLASSSLHSPSIRRLGTRADQPGEFTGTVVHGAHTFSSSPALRAGSL